MSAYRLTDRAIIRLAATNETENVREFLQGLVTNDVSGPLPVYAALLSAQGKCMFDFLVWNDAGDIVIECEAIAADDLVKRLSLYRLRRKIAIGRDENLCAYWSLEDQDGAIADPRLPALGYRWIAPCDDTAPGDDQWRAHRLSCGVTEGQAELRDILWLETNAVELNGVSFEKGCYIGQENTARMNWRQKVNRRLMVVALAQSEDKRCKVAYSDLGLAVDHLRLADINAANAPAWLAQTLKPAG